MPAVNHNTLNSLIKTNLKWNTKEEDRGIIQLYEKSTYIKISRVLAMLLTFKGEWSRIMPPDQYTVAEEIIDQGHIG